MRLICQTSSDHDTLMHPQSSSWLQEVVCTERIKPTNAIGGERREHAILQKLKRTKPMPPTPMMMLVMLQYTGQDLLRDSLSSQAAIRLAGKALYPALFPVVEVFGHEPL